MHLIGSVLTEITVKVSMASRSSPEVIIEAPQFGSTLAVYPVRQQTIATLGEPNDILYASRSDGQGLPELGPHYTHQQLRNF